MTTSISDLSTAFRGGGAGLPSDSPYAAATSRAMPITDMQSGRFAVTSKSSTASSAPTGSMLSTAKPRTDIVRAMSSGDAAPSPKSRSHDTRIFTLSASYRELFQEAQVVFVEEADIVDTVFQHRDELHPQ